MMRNPYVVSGDIRRPLAIWAENLGFTLPAEAFFDGMQDAFCEMMRGIFPKFELIPEHELGPELQGLACTRNLPIVTMEPVYLTTRYRLELTRSARLFTWPRENTSTLVSRNGINPDAQVEHLVQQGLTEVVLADDVIFSGSQILTAIDLLSRHGIRVIEVCAGIGIGDGTERIAQTGVSVRCARRYDSVVDQVCERDFYPGVPYSGRALDTDSRYAVHYVTDLDYAHEWAGIPKKAAYTVCCFCTSLTSQLFTEIERLSVKGVLNQDLARPFYGGSYLKLPAVACLSEEFWLDTIGWAH